MIINKLLNFINNSLLKWFFDAENYSPNSLALKRFRVNWLNPGLWFIFQADSLASATWLA